MYLLILFIPLLSASFTGLGGRFLGIHGAKFFTTCSMIITTLIAWFIFYEVGMAQCNTYLHLYDWIHIGNFQVNFGLQFDAVTATMLIVITSISCLVHLYSTEYMEYDPHLPRFMSYLSLFTFFMLILVTSNNLLQLFIGWEGVGLCSYLLINFWYTRIQANKAAMKAMIVNRVGDVGIALAICAIFYTFQTVEFDSIFSMVPRYTEETIMILGCSVNVITCISLLLLIAAIGKSAQLGLHTWLPDAMEGPTPVSALIHAATMVTAGVFLLIRCSSILEYSSTASCCIVLIGALTAFFAATVGIVKNDIKKVIAYSTCSQLGYMVFACGISNYSASLFHLMNHAFFKALLFLSAGSIIHAMADEQDFRKLGGLIRSNPFTYSMILIGSLSLMGFPFLTGFYSKDAILELAYTHYTFDGTFAFWLGSISAFFTAFYSGRLLYLTFLTNTNAPQNIFSLAHEPSWKMSVPLFLLALGAIVVGFLFKDIFIGLGSTFFGNSIFVLNDHINLIQAEFLDPLTKWTAVILSLCGGIGSIIAYTWWSNKLFQLKTTVWGMKVYTFLNNNWHFDSIYNAFLVKPLLRFGNEISYKLIDRGVIEYIGPVGLSRGLEQFSVTLSRIQSGMIYHYGLLFFVSLTLILTYIGFEMSNLEIIIIIPLGFYINKWLNTQQY